jgi:hypothetical protein
MSNPKCLLSRCPRAVPLSPLFGFRQATDAGFSWLLQGFAMDCKTNWGEVKHPIGSSRAWALAFAIVVYLAYALSFCLPAVVVEGPPRTTVTGFAVFRGVFGSMYGFWFIPLQIPNLAMVLGTTLLVLNQKSWAFFFGLVAVVGAIWIPLAVELEDGNTLGIGYYIWVFSIGLWVLLCWFSSLWRREKVLGSR